MATHRTTWKKRERNAAALFGARRQPGSGSGGRPDETRSDSRHPRLFLECKLRQKHTVVTLWDETKTLAAREGKTPVLMLSEKGRPGQWIVVHSGDLDTLIVETLAAKTGDDMVEIQKRLWKLKGAGE